MIVPTSCRKTCCIQTERNVFFFNVPCGEFWSIGLGHRPRSRHSSKTERGTLRKSEAHLTFVSFCCAIACHLCCFFFLEFARLSLHARGQSACPLTWRAVTAPWKGIDNTTEICFTVFVSRPKGCFFHHMPPVTSTLDFLFQVPEIPRVTTTQVFTQTQGVGRQWLHED